jgi:hypothetical protein
MSGDFPHLSGTSSQLQEAIDTIVQSFGHPDTITLTHTLEKGIKRTQIEISDGDMVVCYELMYDGQDDDSEPQLRRVDDGDALRKE